MLMRLPLSMVMRVVYKSGSPFTPFTPAASCTAWCRCAVLLEEMWQADKSGRNPHHHVVAEVRKTSTIPTLRFAAADPRRLMPLPTSMFNLRRLTKMVRVGCRCGARHYCASIQPAVRHNGGFAFLMDCK